MTTPTYLRKTIGCVTANDLYIIGGYPQANFVEKMEEYFVSFSFVYFSSFSPANILSRLTSI